MAYSSSFGRRKSGLTKLDYAKIYKSIMDRAKGRSIYGYSEKHHVIPKCLGGTNCQTNIVSLFAREHFLAHQLLVKMYPSNRGLAWAALLMANREMFNPGQSKRYDWLRRESGRHSSEEKKGKKPIMTPAKVNCMKSRIGVPLTEEHRQKVSKALKGKPFTESHREAVRAAALLRPKPSAETRLKLSSILMGNTHNKGKRLTEESRAKMSASRTGLKQSQETKDKRSRARRRISDESILGVRRDSLDVRLTYEQIAKRNGTTKTQVGRILRGEKYAQVSAGVNDG